MIIIGSYVDHTIMYFSCPMFDYCGQIELICDILIEVHFQEEPLPVIESTFEGNS